MEHPDKLIADVNEAAAVLAHNRRLALAVIQMRDLQGKTHLALEAVTKLAEKAASQPEQKPVAADTSHPLTIVYTNWRGETAEREIVPTRLWFGATKWHPKPQWLLTALDIEESAERDFAWNGIDFQGDAPPVAVKDAPPRSPLASVTEQAVEAAAHCIGGGSTFDWDDRLEMVREIIAVILPHLSSPQSQPHPVAGEAVTAARVWNDAADLAAVWQTSGPHMNTCLQLAAVMRKRALAALPEQGGEG